MTRGNWVKKGETTKDPLDDPSRNAEEQRPPLDRANERATTPQGKQLREEKVVRRGPRRMTDEVVPTFQRMGE
ncbi:hypothetical protein FOPE_12725 [Fonsecaea pedrosoi]|nr:hypothetical protein FOPE_12725 [Fonsecaea pedrosoi]